MNILRMPCSTLVGYVEVYLPPCLLSATPSGRETSDSLLTSYQLIGLSAFSPSRVLPRVHGII